MLKSVDLELKEKFRKCIEEIWKNDTHMVEWCMQKADNLIELSNGCIIEIEKPTIKKDFCFSHGFCGVSTEEETKNANDMAKYAKENTEYFMEKNLANINRILKDLETYNEVGIFAKYSRQATDNKLRSFVASEYGFDFEHYGYLSDIKTYNNFEVISKEDVQKIIQGYNEVKQAFIKRLNTYLKKYGMSKVRTWTFLSD